MGDGTPRLCSRRIFTVTSKPAGAATAASDRADVLDSLRGFALIGILVTHVPDFSGYTFMPADQRAALDHTGLDHLLAAGLEMFVRGKFLSLFSLLFGIGFAVQLERAILRGDRFEVRYFRRLAALWLIGACHAALWYGDILKDYALLGLALLATSRLRTAGVALAAAGALALRVAWPFAVAAVAPTIAPMLGGGASGDDFIRNTQGLTSQDPLVAFAANLDLVRMKALQLVYEGRFLSILCMFFTGALIGRLRLYRDLWKHKRVFWRTLAVCGPIGLIGNAMLMPLAEAGASGFPPDSIWVTKQAIFAVAVPALTLAYAAAFALVWASGRGQALKLLTAAGRTALSTYVSQTVLGIALFYGVGLGLHGRIGLAGCFVAAIAIFALQSLASAAWLRCFQFGPLEWAWRCVTYGAPVRLRLSTPPRPATSS